MDTYTPTGFRADGRPDFTDQRAWAKPKAEDRDDGLNAARGIINGILIGTLFWVIVAASLWIGWSRAEARHPACDGLTAAECTAYHQSR